MELKAIGIDGGNYNVNSASATHVDRFPSNLCPARARNLENQHGKDDMVVLYESKEYFAGTLAKYEDPLSSETLAGETKNHDEAKLRILIGAWRQLNDGDAAGIVVNQPITQFKKAEVEGIISKLMGVHEMEINGVSKKFEIQRVKVAPEGGAAFWCQPQDGLVHVLDVGSGTVNAATLLDKRYIDAASTTLPFGMETNRDFTPEEIGNAIIRPLSKLWKRKDNVWLIGGGATATFDTIREFFLNTKIMNPVIVFGDETKVCTPDFANAIGSFQMAKRTLK